jgi:hypothetical protein
VDRRVVVVLLVGFAACGGKVTVEQQTQPIDLCACWVARQTEPLPQPPDELGPCMMCWATTVMADSCGNGICHYDQQRCLDDEACFTVVACVQQCADASCVNGCIGAATTEIGHDLFLDWSRCSCMECWDVCSGTAEPEVCSAGL